ncbi:hypothetical protein ABW19_dt0200125 [Dactylella cylindrospora]|nr:hypothetical protein ABW19_dt0200125 [Dactylella cylindrospora]
MPFGIGPDRHSQSSSKASHEDVDLVSLLTRPQREDLVHLITAATEVMRTSLLHTFDPVTKKAQKDTNPQDSADNLQVQDATTRTTKEEAEIAGTRGPAAEPSRTLNIKILQLKHAALASFDQWQQSVLARIYEVMNPPDVDKREGAAVHMQDVIGGSSSETQGFGNYSTQTYPDESTESDFDVENTRYPAIPTNLSNSLPGNAKPVVVHSILLLILSLETYDARSRTLLRIICTSLSVPPTTLTTVEKSVAGSLITAAKASMSAEEERKKKESENVWNRRIKVGLAGVAGAAVIGITGGLAAPLVAAGIGTVMSGIGLGATAAAGYLGALAGSGALVGALFGAYGGKMTGEMMSRYAKEIEDFAFIPVKPAPSSPRPSSPSKSKFSIKSKPGNSTETVPSNNRLTVTIGISGWITNPADFVTPWQTLSDSTEVYALRWETTALLDLGSALTTMLKTYAFAYLKTEIIKRTVLASLMMAMWPIGLLKIAKVVDNPFSIAKTRSEKAGAVLADALINRAQGGRPVTLVAYSLGSRLVYSALLNLAERNAFGVVENVYILGSPVPSNGDEWIAMRSVVSGRLVSVYSENDYILAFLYRTSAAQVGVAGLQKVDWPDEVENVDVSKDVEGHLRYRFLVGDIVGKVGGGEMVDWEVVKEERRVAEEMKRAEEKLEKEAKEKEGDGGEGELEEVARKVEEQKRERHVVRDVGQMRMAS